MLESKSKPSTSYFQLPKSFNTIDEALHAQHTTLKRKHDTLKAEYVKLRAGFDFYRAETTRLKTILNAQASRPATGLDLKPNGSITCGLNIDEYGSNFTTTLAALLSTSSADTK